MADHLCMEPIVGALANAVAPGTRNQASKQGNLVGSSMWITNGSP